MAPRETKDELAALHLEGRSVEVLGVICESAFGELQRRLAEAKCNPEPNAVGQFVASAVGKLRAAEAAEAEPPQTIETPVPAPEVSIDAAEH